MVENKKASIVLVLNTLKDYSDEKHFLTHQQIINIINKRYNILLERKSVAYSILLLEQIGYVINKSPRGGFYLANREFNKDDILLLVDAIYSLKSCSNREAKNLVNKINESLSIYERKEYNHLYKNEDILFTKNDELIGLVNIIENAISKNKKISFEYITFDNNAKRTTKNKGTRYIVSPYYVVNNFGQYYLIANYKEKNPLQLFRIDSIKNLEIEESELLAHKDIPSIEDFDVKKFLNDNIYLLNGKIINAKVEVLNKKNIKTLIDYFGSNAKLSKENGKIIALITVNERALINFMMDNNSKFTLLSPKSSIETLKKEAFDILSKYKN